MLIEIIANSTYRVISTIKQWLKYNSLFEPGGKSYISWIYQRHELNKNPLHALLDAYKSLGIEIDIKPIR